MKLALTGGIACGKSMFAKFLEELGIRVLDADDIVHELESPGGDAVPALVAVFGQSILAADGGIDRQKLAQRVFNSKGNVPDRKLLENILFPLVRERLLAFVQSTDLRIAIIPLLFESHFDADYDTIIALVSPQNVQIERMMRTRGYSREQAEARIAAQMPVAEKAARAHFVVINDSTPEHLRDEARRLLAWLKERARYE